MYRIISFFTLFLLLSCSGGGIEGFVDEPITIKAKNPEEGQDFDFIWTLENQPDGSLISSRDLLIKENGQKIIFIPDYPGDYSIELIISKYGDEIEKQSFTFTISDGGSSEPEQSKQNTKKTDNEDWLNDEYNDEEEYEDDEEEYEDDEEEYEDDEEEYEDDEEEYEDDEEEYKDDEEEYEDDEEEYEDDEEEYEDDEEEYEDDGNMITHSKPSGNTQLIKNSKKNKKSISEKTDRFTIQITSKRSLKDAQSFSNELIKKGYDVYIQKVVIKTNETWYRVRIGSYDNYNAANIAAKTLSKSLGFNTWVDFVRKEQK